MQFLTDRYNVTRQSFGDWVKTRPAIKVGHNQYNLAECDLYVITSLKEALEKSKKSNQTEDFT